MKAFLVEDCPCAMASSDRADHAQALIKPIRDHAVVAPPPV
jgi:hypothetical protein